jgi:hypothetical protein
MRDRPEKETAGTVGFERCRSSRLEGRAKGCGGGQEAVVIVTLLRRHDDLKSRAFNLPQFFVHVRNTRVGGHGNRPFDPIVGDEHAVLPQPLENGLHCGREAADLEVSLESDPLAHAGIVGVGVWAGVVGGRSDSTPI